MKEEGKRIEQPDGAPEPTKRWTLQRIWREWRETILILLAVFVTFKCILQIAWVPSGSMETTLPVRSVLIGWQLTYLVADPVPERGSVVTFWSDELNKVLVKRVIGLPGDAVSFADGYVYVNGQQQEEAYLPAQGITDCTDTFQVPEGHIFVLGDNRTGSFDSRFWNDPYVPINQIQAKPFLVISLGKNQSWQGVRLIEQGGNA